MASRTNNTILNQSSNIPIDPNVVEQELMNNLTQKAAYFYIGNIKHSYQHEESIFFRNGPVKT